MAEKPYFVFRICFVCAGINTKYGVDAMAFLFPVQTKKQMLCTLKNPSCSCHSLLTPVCNFDCNPMLFRSDTFSQGNNTQMWTCVTFDLFDWCIKSLPHSYSSPVSKYSYNCKEHQRLLPSSIQNPEKVKLETMRNGHRDISKWVLQWYKCCSSSSLKLYFYICHLSLMKSKRLLS